SHLLLIVESRGRRSCQAPPPEERKRDRGPWYRLLRSPVSDDHRPLARAAEPSAAAMGGEHLVGHVGPADPFPRRGVVLEPDHAVGEVLVEVCGQGQLDATAAGI